MLLTQNQPANYLLLNFPSRRTGTVHSLMELGNNKILITGATSGIDRALAKEFLKHDNAIIHAGIQYNHHFADEQQHLTK